MGILIVCLSARVGRHGDNLRPNDWTVATINNRRPLFVQKPISCRAKKDATF